MSYNYQCPVQLTSADRATVRLVHERAAKIDADSADKPACSIDLMAFADELEYAAEKLRRRVSDAAYDHRMTACLDERAKERG